LKFGSKFTAISPVLQQNSLVLTKHSQIFFNVRDKKTV
jgi:hypothetical protein